MDKNTLLIFANRIFSSCSKDKAMVSLNQLRTLLSEQGADQSLIVLLTKMLTAAPEIKEITNSGVLTEADVHISERRAKERIAREEAARYHGRC